ncbi:hypothetical protein [Flavobacterium bizetiae]|uniref:hypothetical protein n=1 Tax=Flavobacterium bizetiae TaxID=2704140 RepID=UPI0037581905
MILNYNELLICIKRIEKQIPMLELEQRKLIHNLNFSKTRQVFAQQQLLELQILNYITYYQEKIKNNYLENKIFSGELCNLKENYRPKTNAIIFFYCLKELATEYNDLLKDLKLFYKLNSLKDVESIKEKIENHTSLIEEVFLELSRIILLSKSDIADIQIKDFNSFVMFFQGYYNSKILSLEKNLHKKQKKLKSFKTLLNYNMVISIRREIKTIKDELEAIYIRKNNLKFIDQIDWEYNII